jgi:transcriptional regulator with XRE-family HTH domain
MSNMYKDLRSNIEARRKARKMSHAEVAAKATLSRPYITMILTGARTPSLRAIEKLAKALQCTTRDLLRTRGA